jgi:hypothetical protein
VDPLLPLCAKGAILHHLLRAIEQCRYIEVVLTGSLLPGLLRRDEHVRTSADKSTEPGNCYVPEADAKA